VNKLTVVIAVMAVSPTYNTAFVSSAWLPALRNFSDRHDYAVL